MRDGQAPGDSADHESELIEALRRHWRYSGNDEAIAHEIYHADAVLEFPQSGERFDGVSNFLPWRVHYPAVLRFRIRRITQRGDVVIAENLISYNGAPWLFTVNLLEFRGNRITRERIYIMAGWEAPAWRSPWRSARSADEVPASP